MNKRIDLIELIRFWLTKMSPPKKWTIHRVPVLNYSFFHLSNRFKPLGFFYQTETTYIAVTHIVIS